MHPFETSIKNEGFNKYFEYFFYNVRDLDYFCRKFRKT